MQWSHIFRVFLFIFLILLSDSRFASGTPSRVKKARVETPDGIVFSIWVSAQTFKEGQDVSVGYSVQNNSPSAIYLVNEHTREIFVDRPDIQIPAPFPIPNGHGGYDFTFTRIGAGKIVKGALTIPGYKISEDSPWFIGVGFAYLNDMKGITTRWDPSQDPIVPRRNLFSREKTLKVGSLLVEIVK